LEVSAVDVKIPKGQTYCGAISGYRTRMQMGPKAVTLWTPPVVFFTDAVVFGGNAPLSHRLLASAGMLVDDLGGVKGLDMLADHQIDHDWTRQNETIVRLIQQIGEERLSAAQVLQALSNSVAIPNAEFTSVTMSAKKGWLHPKVYIKMIRQSGKKKEYNVSSSAAETLKLTLSVAFGTRFHTGW
jgi:hypothetical protein